MQDYSFSQIEYIEDRELSLQKSPGIYAWYRDISSASFSDEPDDFFKELLGLLDSPLSDVFHAQAGGYLYSISVVEKTRCLSDKKRSCSVNFPNPLLGENFL
jgi:hypothetical protein